VDYSRFEDIERAEKAAEGSSSDSKGRVALAKYVDSDGDTVSAPSDDELEPVSKDAKLVRRKDNVENDTEEWNGVEVPPDVADDSESDDDDFNEDEDLHPLFWRRMPKKGTKGDGMAEVLHNMVYKNDKDEDKTANELANDFKEKGNEFYKWGEKFFKKAMKEYKEALQWARKGDGRPENQICYASILSNRAAINLKWQNFGSVVRDCEAAIKYGPDPLPNCKTHYRAALASFELGKMRDAVTFAKGGLDIDPSNELLQSVWDKADNKLAEQRTAQRQKEREMMLERKLDEEMRKQCQARGLRIGPLVNDISNFLARGMGQRTQGGFPRPTYFENSMQWPVMLMYPEVMQTEFIQSFDMSHSFRAHLLQMFPQNQNDLSKKAHWDSNGNYTVDKLEVYFEERYVEPFDMSKMWASQYNKRLETEDYSKKLRVKVSLDASLSQALKDPGYVVPGIPTFYVVSNSTVFYSDVFVKEHKGRFRILG